MGKRKRQAKAAADSEAAAAAASNSNLASESALADSTGGDTSSTKRKHVEGSTPAGVKPVSKRPHAEGTPGNYKDAAVHALQAAIVFAEDHGQLLTGDQGAHVQSELMAALQSATADPMPRFEKSGLLQGSFLVTCADQASFDWLLQQAPSISAWEGRAFAMVKATSPPKLTKMYMAIPGPAKKK